MSATTVQTQHEFQVAGRRRLVRVVNASTVRRDAPIVLLMHGAYQTGATVIARAGVEQFVARTGAIVLAPDGIDRLWRSDLDEADHGGDITLMETLVDHARNEWDLSGSGRVVAAGFSNGGMFSMRLACQRPHLVSAALSVAGSMRHSVYGCTDGDGHLDRVTFVHGTLDPVINARRPERSIVGLLIGGSFVRGVLPLDDAVERWVDMIGLHGGNVVPHDGPATIRSWHGGDHGFELRQRLLPGAFHGWVPGATDELERLLAPLD